jgi:cytochrome P450
MLTGQSSVSPFEFDPEAPGFDADPYPAYRYLREEAPVYWWPAARGWLVSRYEDVVWLQKDSRLSLAYLDWEHAQMPPPGYQPTAYDMLMAFMLFQLSDKDHARVRKLASPAFTPRAIERMRGKIEVLVDEILSRHAPGDRIDIVHVLSEILPMRVIGGLLDVPEEFEPTFHRFGVAFIEATTPWLSFEERARITAPVPAGIELLEKLIADRRSHPKDDFLSTLIHYQEEGDCLSTQELLSLVAAIIIAGSDTTGHLISYAIWNLLRHPEQGQLVKDDPSLMHNALEEVLRYDPFGKRGNPRYAREDFMVRDVQVKKGQMVMAMGPAALRDPSAFPNPDTFDIRRDTSASIAFGLGPHYCLGVHLARLEAEIAMNAFFARFPTARLDGSPTYARHPFFRKMDTLYVVL